MIGARPTPAPALSDNLLPDRGAERARSRDQHRFRQTLKEARAGQTEAQYQLGLMFANGVGTPRDLTEALAWIQRAAERGHAAAQYMLGSHYCAEPGTAPEAQTDEARAFEWLFRAAAQGHPRAHWRLARLIRQSHHRLAAAHETLAASLGLPEAQVAVAKADADAGLTDAATAEQLRLQALRMAAEQGLPGAQTELGQALLARAAAHGRGTDEVEGLGWLQRAAARHWPPALLALAEAGVAPATLPAPFPDPVDAAARHALGCVWERGLCGLPVQPAEAQRWYALAAAQGHREARLALGRLAVSAGQTEAAAAHYRQAAEAGSAEAAWCLAGLLDTPAAPMADRLQARGWRARAEQGGHPPALLALAQDDSRQAADAELREHALQRAAEAGLPEAQRCWGQRLLARAAGSHPDAPGLQRQAAEWLQRAARQGDAAALTAVAMAYRQGLGVTPDLSLGLQLLHEARHQGDPGAAWQLALLHAAGCADVPRDPAQAVQLCREAAEAGFVPAQATLGVLLAAQGDPAAAVQAWREAAEAGDPEAQVNLATALQQGRGTRADPAEAFRWLLKAADSGLAAAQARLGLAYATGRGVIADPLAAHQWFFIARQGGDASAAQNLARSREQLPEAARLEAEQRARAWLDSVAFRPQPRKQS
jgi:hypothetical protein